ncbi:DUF4097 family beta strand repeat protein [Fusibacter paucivorans]|uniref:DUF4097 family beta strand repeat protein n=1 Tax=Fusibacter paucivorans TaxID=76009 RepID=A0ABS5PQF6_9FIRM|nr:DUF4097 family beta strand repeat-containing protein [Fusibacter paucivorans]MBS7527298.1 DUF4097 family beta strand repeat protein [Fusibacter paucivorans]
MGNKLEILKMIEAGNLSAEEALSMIEAVDQAERIEQYEISDIKVTAETITGSDTSSYKDFDIALIASRLNVEKSNVDDVTIEIMDSQTRELVPKPEWLVFKEEGSRISIQEHRPQSLNDLIDFVRNSAQILKQTLFINIKLPMHTVVDHADISSVSGNLSMIGLKGLDLNLKSVSGNIHLMQVKSSKIGAKTTSGTVIIEDVKCANGSYGSTSGKVKVNGEHSRIKLKNVSGGIQYDDSGDVKEVVGNSVSGKIEVRVKAPERYNLKLDSISGSIDTSGFAVVEKESTGRKHVSITDRSTTYEITLGIVSGKIILDSVV